MVMSTGKLALAILWLLPVCTVCQRTTDDIATSVMEVVKFRSPTLALTHLRIIDGTGAAPHENQTLIIGGGIVQSIAPSENARIPERARVVDLSGRTAFPGLVGMHDHLYYTAALYDSGPLLQQQSFTFPRLYLANGVTTIRTAGSIAPDTDLNLKNLIDAGEIPGPRIHFTGPYLEGPGGLLEMSSLRTPQETRATVEYWADRGATSFKAYTHITRAQLQAAVDAAHARGLKITGQLCSVGFQEAAEMGIDNLEHGFAVDTEFNSLKKPDLCPPGAFVGLTDIDVSGLEIRRLIHLLVRKHVAITSTLAVFEQYVSGRPDPSDSVLGLMSSVSRSSCLGQRDDLRREQSSNQFGVVLKKEMLLERAFVKAGGLLMTGADPTGNGCVLAGFGDLRGLELLVEAGFTPTEVIQIATSNGAKFLGVSDKIGTLEPGKVADLVVVRGDPTKDIRDIENTETTFKDGLGHDPAKLLQQVKSNVGFH